MSNASMPSVMLIEDDADIRLMISQLLELEGYRVVAAEQAEEALAMLRGGERPGVILLDLMMPGMNGWQFRDEQVQQSEAIASIPVVVMSGDCRVAESSVKVGAAGYLKKPLDLRVLLQTVARYCMA